MLAMRKIIAHFGMICAPAIEPGANVKARRHGKKHQFFRLASETCSRHFEIKCNNNIISISSELGRNRQV